MAYIAKWPAARGFEPLPRGYGIVVVLAAEEVGLVVPRHHWELREQRKQHTAHRRAKRARKGGGAIDHWPQLLRLGAEDERLRRHERGRLLLVGSDDFDVVDYHLGIDADAKLWEGVREGVREDADHVVEATFHRNLQQEEGGGSKRATPASPRSHPISGNAMEVGGSEPLSAPRIMTRPLGAVDPFYLKAQYSLLSPRPKGSASPTWVRPHVGPTNDRLVISLGLSGTSGVTLRVGNRTRGWPEDDKALVFDDSFEHEVTHTGEATRAVLIVHFAHPMAMPAGTNGAAVVRLGEGVCDRETGEMELLRAAVGPLG